ncbi:hypothetical protein VM1G_11676 [Cytospora mali]|uniref:Uncharacterized protein n=1 Tax=Cytospora mali TaxID=578113 RepID=A0A194W2L2_CYTMA|nr:hypothetical protein VM1G_11676 [Valsa mali]
MTASQQQSETTQIEPGRKGNVRLRLRDAVSSSTGPGCHTLLPICEIVAVQVWANNLIWQ